MQPARIEEGRQTRGAMHSGVSCGRLFRSLLTGCAAIFSVGRGPSTMGAQNMGCHMAACRVATREPGVEP